MLDRRSFLKASTTLMLLPYTPVWAATPLKMAYFETYSPLSFSENGTMRGLIVDIVETVFRRFLNTSVESSGFPWIRAQALVQNGQYDGICTVATPARLQYAVAATEAVVSAPTRIFVRADNPLLPKLKEVKNLDELSRLNASVLSYAGNGWAKAKLTNFNVNWGGDFSSSLSMLVGKRGDIMVENAISMQFSLNKIPGGDEVIMLPNSMDQVDFQLLLSKSSPHVGLLSEFNAALHEFKKTEDYANIYKEYGLIL